MLQFFAKRLNQLREVKRDERGFTLIELLVVVIIIGVLAAIAIPTFLSQRERAQDSAAQSDLRNLASAATSYQAANTPANDYTGMDLNGLETNHGYNPTDGVTMSAPTIGGGGDFFTVNATSAASNQFHFDSRTGEVASGPATP